MGIDNLEQEIFDTLDKELAIFRLNKTLQDITVFNGDCSF